MHIITKLFCVDASNRYKKICLKNPKKSTRFDDVSISSTYPDSSGCPAQLVFFILNSLGGTEYSQNPSLSKRAAACLIFLLGGCMTSQVAKKLANC